MFNRAGAAVCAAAIAGVLLVPVPLSARGGAGMGHHGGFRPIVRPHHHVHPPFVHPHRPPFVHRDIRKQHDFHGDGHHADGHRRHRGIFTVPLFGYSLPVTYGDDSAFYGNYYDPSDYIRTIVVPVYPVPPAPLPPYAGLPDPPPERVGCRSETVSVAAPSGAERSVTITRC
jgi:hypothetical protein